LRRYILPLLILALAAGYAIWRSEQRPAAPKDATSSQAVPPVTLGADQPVLGQFEKVAGLPGIEGIIVSDPQGDVDLGRYKGKALLINVWATWCAPCIAEMPSLDRLQAKLGGDKFAVVTVAVDEPSMTAVQNFIDQKQLHNLPVLVDLNHAIDHKVRVPNLPTSLLVSPDGIIQARFAGDSKWDCGAPLAALQAFVKDGTVPLGQLESCPD